MPIHESKNIITQTIPFDKIYDYDFYKKIINIIENELFVGDDDYKVENNGDEWIGIFLVTKN